mgnify:CR=1 FL=1
MYFVTLLPFLFLEFALVNISVRELSIDPSSPPYPAGLLVETLSVALLIFDLNAFLTLLCLHLC